MLGSRFDESSVRDGLPAPKPNLWLRLPHELRVLILNQVYTAKASNFVGLRSRCRDEQAVPPCKHTRVPRGARAVITAKTTSIRASIQTLARNAIKITCAKSFAASYGVPQPSCKICATRCHGLSKLAQVMPGSDMAVLLVCRQM